MRPFVPLGIGRGWNSADTLSRMEDADILSLLGGHYVNYVCIKNEYIDMYLINHIVQEIWVLLILNNPLYSGFFLLSYNILILQFQPANFLGLFWS